jgi:hypothetical protein
MTCAVLVNTTPKFFYLLEAHFGLLRRYGEGLDWPVYLATECPTDPVVERVSKKYNVKILPLLEKDSDFLESRLVAVNMLPPEIKYVLPLQEDFLLERPGPDMKALNNALEILNVDESVKSIRLMPCPGSSAREGFWGVWKKLLPEDMKFSYQATIWRREVYSNYFARLIQQGRGLYPDFDKKMWNNYAIRVNPAETHPGFFLLKTLYPDGVHLCWPRKGAWANAVYACPWPYRPTAVVKGVLQPWAEELMVREGFTLSKPT